MRFAVDPVNCLPLILSDGSIEHLFDPCGIVLTQSSATSTYGCVGEQFYTSTAAISRGEVLAPAQGWLMKWDIREGKYFAPLVFNTWNYVQENPIIL
jgi:hypothetical protein